MDNHEVHLNNPTLIPYWAGWPHQRMRLVILVELCPLPFFIDFLTEILINSTKELVLRKPGLEFIVP